MSALRNFGAEGTPHTVPISSLQGDLLSFGQSAIMEAFSVAAKANAQRFLARFAGKPVPTIKVDAPPPLPLHWPRIAEYELEGTVLDMVRCYLAVK